LTIYDSLRQSAGVLTFSTGIYEAIPGFTAVTM
jgi:hypothetical protein